MVDARRALPFLNPSSSADETAPVFTVGNADAPVVRGWHPLLTLTYVVEDNGVLVLVRERDLQGMTFEELHNVAMANLRAHATIRTESYGDATLVILDNKYEASLLLIDEIWDDTLARQVRGEIVVAAPAHNVLAFTSASSRTGLTDLKNLVRRHHRPGNDHLLVPQFFVRRDRDWDVFDSSSQR